MWKCFKRSSDGSFSKESFTSPKGLYNYFKIYFNLYKAETPSVSLESLFEKYEEPPKRKSGIKVSNVAELVSKLKNEAKVI